ATRATSPAEGPALARTPAKAAPVRAVVARYASAATPPRARAAAAPLRLVSAPARTSPPATASAQAGSATGAGRRRRRLLAQERAGGAPGRLPRGRGSIRGSAGRRVHERRFGSDAGA